MKTKVTVDNIKLLSHKDIVRFALFCTKQVDSKTPEAIACIRVVERWLVGKATSDECHAAAAVASANAAYTAYAAAHAAVHVAAAAYAAAAAATRAAYAANAAHTARAAQERYLYELLNINDIIEQTLLANN